VGTSSFTAVLSCAVAPPATIAVANSIPHNLNDFIKRLLGF
jgi:hypothetical protein